MRIKDLSTQQSLKKVLLEMKSADIEEIDWADMKEKTTKIIHLCVSHEVLYHIMNLEN